MNKLGEKIKELRLERQLNKKELAQMAGVSIPIINGLEKGGYRASDLTIAKIAKALEVDFMELLALKEN